MLPGPVISRLSDLKYELIKGYQAQVLRLMRLA